MRGRSFAGLLIGKRLTTEHSEKGDFCGLNGKWPQSKEPGEERFFSGNENYIPYLLSVPRQPRQVVWSHGDVVALCAARRCLFSLGCFV